MIDQGRDDRLELAPEETSKIYNANGLVVTDGGATLLVAEHLEAQVLRYSIAADGSLSDRQVWKRLPDLVLTPADAGPTYGCDGIKRDAKGNIYIANNGGGRLLITDPGGELLHTVEVPYKAVSNVGLGPDVSAERTGGEAGDAESFLYISAVKDESDPSYPGALFKAPSPER